MAENYTPAVRNELLAALPADILAQLLPKLAPVDLPRRQSLYVMDHAIDAVFFIESGMASLVRQLDDGVQAEVGIIGREGMLGIPLLHGVETSFTDCFMQLPGDGLRMPAAAFRQELATNPALRALLLRYAEAQSDQVAQTAACNGRHGLEQRLARWLLMAHDRADGDVLPLTQEFMAMMLGVHRPSITITAGILQRAGLIRYASGVITIVDRPSLEAAACECHRVVRRRFERLMGTPPA
ncbi:MAG TPA: Crp/Fnr family transcriptional regulator [Acidisphaera sp.]|nr:Crp/Fnr family transcriptional regulator [Acidisphaera sp.]